MWIYYLTTGPFPKVPRAGVGIVDAMDRPNPPPGYTALKVDPTVLVHGRRNRDIEEFYRVLDARTLAPRSASEIAQMRAERARPAKIAEARAEGKRRRVELSPVPVDEVDFFLADVMVRQYEVARGRANQQDEAAVESLVSRLKQMRAVKTAEDTIVAEIEASDDPASYDVPNSPHWPRITP